MKAVVLDGYTVNPGDLDWSIISGIEELIVFERTSREEIQERVKGASILITNKTIIDRDVMNYCPTLKMIAVLATGYNVVDIEEAKRKKIIVCNVPDYGSNTVSQFAISLLLEICSRIGVHDNLVHQGQWENSEDWCFTATPLIELYGKTMGIVGYGRIGRRTGEIAKALGMNVIANDIFINPECKDTRYVSFEELCKQADVIVFHCSLNKDNYHMVNQKTIQLMKKNVIIINNARGDLICEKDLADALNNRRILAAGLDVVSNEPILAENPLLKAENCIITPHMSWMTKEARKRILETTNENIRMFLQGQAINVVNL